MSVCPPSVNSFAEAVFSYKKKLLEILLTKIGLIKKSFGIYDHCVVFCQEYSNHPDLSINNLVQKKLLQRKKEKCI